MDVSLAIKKAVSEDRWAAQVTVTEIVGDPPSQLGRQIAVLEDGTRYGTLGCDGFDTSGTRDALRSIEQRRKLRTSYEWEPGSYVSVEVRPFGPGEPLDHLAVDIPELLVVGTGPVARALVALGEAMGFHVRVAAGPGAPKVGEFDGADEVIITKDAREVEAIRPGPNTNVVICGHDEEFSQQVLMKLVGGESPYIGMMGSRRHTSHIYDELERAGVSEEVRARVHTPVGLDLGAETPEEIALSVLSQIVALKRGGSGRPLDEPE